MDETDRATAKGDVYRRAFSHFASDWPWIAALVVLPGVNVAVGLLEAWPLAVLVDSALTREPRGDWFLALLPADKPGQIVGLVLIGLALQIIGYSAWMARMMNNYRLNYRGTTRVRADLFSKLQRLDLGYHQSRPQGDPLKWLAEFFTKVRTFEAAARRVFFVLDWPETIRSEPGARALAPRPRRLAFENVSFGYRPGSLVLSQVSAMIAPGGMAAFVGPSGAGKSSLLKMMLRFQDPVAGVLRLDGVDIRRLRLDSLRAHFALVTHRLHSVVDCDCVFVMEGGRIVERGGQAELLARGGAYARLWRPEAAEDGIRTPQGGGARRAAGA